MHLKNKISSLQFIVLGYLITIMIGTLLLCLPFSNKAGEWVPFLNSLFTATSATCVTGLVVYDTFTQWNMFGQVVILILIQIGGLGFMTVITLIFMLLKKSIGLYERTILLQSAGTFSFNGIMGLIKKIIIITFSTEFIGMCLLSIQFIQDFGFWEGIWVATFHAVSAYCNAGFDILGRFGEFSSLSHYYNNPLVVLTICALVLIGGIGFIVYSDLFQNKFKFKNLNTHSKIVLVYSLIITVVPTFIFLGIEYNHSLAICSSFGEKLLGAFFLSVTPRTAGMSIFDASTFSEAGNILTILLMIIGGNSGSTAGGLKLTTIVVVVANLYSNMIGKPEVTLFKRKVPDGVVKQSSALIMLYILIVGISSLVICACEDYSSSVIVYETVSGLSTVGLSLNVTPNLKSWISKVVIIFLMFAGRVGALTLFSSFVNKIKIKGAYLKVTEGKILVG